MGVDVDRSGRRAAVIRAPVDGNGSVASSTRRDEILDAAADIFATSGVRASLKEIADACGILPGSLYHHFESKDAILVELLERYQADLDDIAGQVREALRRPGGRSWGELLLEAASAIADCGQRHRAALQLTLFEPPSGSSPVLTQAIESPRTSTLERALRDLLRAGQRSGELRVDLDRPRFADRLCQAMLHLSVGIPTQTPPSQRVAAVKARILLDGVALEVPANAILDRSPAFRAAEDVISGWHDHPGDEDERWAVLRAAARGEFGRRGYEATTIRDIASVAGMSTGTVYRLIGSKEELLLSVMRSFADNITAGWEAVLASPSTSVEKLDALMWVDINVLARYRDEYRIQLASLRVVPDIVEHGWLYSRRLREIRTLLAQGSRRGEIQLSGGTADERAWCVLELVWMPERFVAAGTRSALALARDTVLRGASART